MHNFAVNAAAANPASIKVYGASDDLIEIEGDIYDEFGGGDDPKFLHFSDGTVLSVHYGDGGIWRVERVVEGTAEYKREECSDPDADPYSDVVTLTGEIDSVTLWSTPGEVPDEAFRDMLDENVDWDGLNLDELRAVWRAVTASIVRSKRRLRSHAGRNHR